MPEVVNTSFLGSNIDIVENLSEETMIKIDDVSMVFNMASETMNNLKEYVIALARGELRFKEFRALDHISFEVKKGDVFGILGTNGSGKSTLLKLIAGVLEPSEGTCTVNGSIAPLIELGAGFDMELTARENIFLNGALLGYSKKFIEEHFDEIVEFAEIEQFLDMPLKNYSSGMVARIAFAIATVIVPEILIVDEVLSVGDFMFQQKCERRISALIEEHSVTVLIVSHDNNLIERLCNKAVWIEKSHLRMLGAAEDVCHIYRMIGGRSGEPESEKLITDTLFDSTIKPDSSLYSTIKGDKTSSYSVKLTELTYPTTSETVILTPTFGSAENYSSLSLANYYDCPILTIDREEISESTRQAILRLKPKNFIIVGNESDIPLSFESVLNHDFDAKEIIRLSGNNAAEISLAVFGHLKKLGFKSKTALVSYKECVGDLNTLSPWIYKWRIPVFFNWSPLNIDHSTDEILKSFERIVIVAGDGQISNSFESSLLESGIKTVRLLGDGPFDANIKINSWLYEEYASSNLNRSRNLIISSFWQPEKAFTLGIYAGKNDSVILLDDPGDLNSVAILLKYLQANAERYDSMLFVGDEEHFNDNDKKLLTKALIKGKNSMH